MKKYRVSYWYPGLLNYGVIAIYEATEAYFAKELCIRELTPKYGLVRVNYVQAV